MYKASEHFLKVLILLSVTGLGSGSECGVQNIHEKIANGKETALDEYPWTALIRYREAKSGQESWACAGSLTSERIILTAAHCVENAAIERYGEIQFVRLGEYDYNSEKDCKNGLEDCADAPIDYKVINTVIHPDRNSTNNTHDIAILVLNKVPPYTSFIRPICLPEENLPNERLLFVTGWGWTTGTSESPSNVKMHVAIDYVNMTQCLKFYKKDMINENFQMCAGGKNGRNACSGDSGGPLMQYRASKWTLAGIVSFGASPCAVRAFNGIPTVFTRITGYLPWIRSVLLSLINEDKVFWET